MSNCEITKNVIVKQKLNLNFMRDTVLTVDEQTIKQNIRENTSLQTIS